MNVRACIQTSNQKMLYAVKGSNAISCNAAPSKPTLHRVLNSAFTKQTWLTRGVTQTRAFCGSGAGGLQRHRQHEFSVYKTNLAHKKRNTNTCILRLWRRRLAKTSAAISLLQPVSFCISHGRQALWKLVAECFQVARSVHPIHDSSGPFRPLRLSFLPRHDARLLRTHSFSEESDGGFVQEKIRHVRGLHSGISAPVVPH